MQTVFFCLDSYGADIIIKASADKEYDSADGSVYTYADQARPEKELMVGYSAEYGIMTAYLKFDLAGIDSNRTIQSAELRFYVNALDYKDDNIPFVEIYRATGDDWGDIDAGGGTCSDTRLPFIGARIPNNTAVSDREWKCIEVTEFIQEEFQRDKVASFALCGTNSGADSSFFFCTREETGAEPCLEITYAPVAPPAVTTGSVGDITKNSATIEGAVTASGGAEVTGRGMVYSISPNPATADNKVPASAGGTGTFSVDLSGLAQGTVYYARAYAINSEGTSYGSEVTFTTATVPGKPTITSVKEGNGEATVYFNPPASNGGSAITGYTVISNPGHQTASGEDSPLTVSGLTNGTAYTFTVVATNDAGDGEASDPAASVTPCTVSTVSTGLASQITGSGATVGGDVIANGGATVSERGIVYSISANPTTITGIKAPAAIGGTGTFSVNISGLAQGTVYFARAYATNAAGTSYGSEITFTTGIVPGKPTIVNVTAGNGAATVYFEPPAPNGGSEITGYTVTSSPGNFSQTGGTSPLTVSGLANGTAYTFTVIATNAAGDSPASAPSVSVTPCTAPTVNTGSTSNITGSGATITGNVSASGGATVVERGIVYSTTANPSINKDTKAPAATGGTGTFSVDISGLTQGTL